MKTVLTDQNQLLNYFADSIKLSKPGNDVYLENTKNNE
jgi:hypothetical protein